ALVRRMSRPEVVGGDEITRDGFRAPSEFRLMNLLTRIHLLQKLEEMMWQAGLYSRVSDVLLIMAILFLFGVVAAGAAWGDTLIALLSGVGLATLPIFYIRTRRHRRLKAFIEQLPYALDLIKSSLEAGHSLMRGCQVVTAEFADPIGSEFRSVIEQSRLGLPLPRALEEMLKRVPEDDLRLLVVAVKVQSEVGSSLAEIIGRLCEIVRTRQRLYQQIRALTAQGRMSGMIVGFLPVVLLGAFSVMQPEYTHTLFHDPGGIMILKVATILDLLAFITIRQLLKVKF
ncbi:MAG: type II secretion system F family protein, partial [Candidatus Binataceae bacterium]